LNKRITLAVYILVHLLALTLVLVPRKVQRALDHQPLWVKTASLYSRK